MPVFRIEELEIDPEEFVDSCSKRELKELIDYLIQEDYIVASSRIMGNHLSMPEKEFEDTLNKLHGKYRNLTKEEEEIIKIISNRF